MKNLSVMKRNFLKVRVARNFFDDRVTYFYSKKIFFSIQHSHFIFLLYITLIIRIDITFIITLLLCNQHILNAHKVLYVIIDLAKTKTTAKANMIQQRSEDQC